jgi:hypothetical protein
MANLPETATYDAGVYQLETTDPVQGGASGVSNAPQKNLTNRTAWLKQRVDDIVAGLIDLTGYAKVASPTFTGNPLAPTPALGDNDTSISTTAFVQATYGGVLTKSVAGGSNVTLTTVEAGNGILIFTGAITANIAVILPTSPTKHWVAVNRTTGSFSLSVKTAAGTGVVVPQNAAVVIYCDGVNVGLASAAGQTSMTQYPFSPSAGATSLTILNGYTPGNVMVEKNGALLERTTDYTDADGATISLTTVTVAGDKFTVYVFNSFTVANAIQKSGDTMTGPLLGPTPSSADNSTLYATTAWVYAALGNVMTGLGFAASFGSNGYLKLPSALGGLVFEWGTAATSTGVATFTYPLALGTQTYAVYANYLNSGNLGYLGVTVKTSTLTTTAAYLSDAAGTPLNGGNIGFLVIGK